MRTGQFCPSTCIPLPSGSFKIWSPAHTTHSQGNVDLNLTPAKKSEVFVLFKKWCNFLRYVRYFVFQHSTGCPTPSLGQWWSPGPGVRRLLSMTRLNFPWQHSIRDGGFLKWWYPTTIGFPTKNDHFGVFWRYHHLRKHP